VAASATGILHAGDGQHILLSGGREMTIKVDSQLTPAVRMITEDVPPAAEIRVHLDVHNLPGPNRRPAQLEANRKKHGIVYRQP
jgi:hypothetical protein